VRDAVILAGGAATRLGALAADTPKCLLEIGGHPLLDQLAWNLRRHGIERIVVAAGRLGGIVERHVGDGGRWGMQADVSVEPAPLGTGGALKLAASRLDADEFLVLNGDTLVDLNYLDLALLRRETGAEAAIALRCVPDATRYGVVTPGPDDTVAAFAEKSAGGAGLVSSGVYVVSRSLLDRIPPGACSLETDVLPAAVDEGRVVARSYGGWFVDIGVPEALDAGRREAGRWRGRPAVLLDRDGVLNEDRGHVHAPGEFGWMPGAVEAVKWLNDEGYLVMVVTNQAGIARGLYTEDEYRAFERWISDRLRERGAHIDAWYHCPHHPTVGVGELRVVCDCRKPAPGMLLRAIDEWELDPSRCLFLGDKDTDLEAARGAGIEGALYRHDDLAAFVRAHAPAAAHRGA
jgi:D,D-heptose 1,7-bisphosphate phosphatase